MRLVFMGTPSFVVPILQDLVAHQYSVVGVFTKPDEDIGRKQIPSPVKVAAEALGLRVYQFPRVRKREFAQTSFMEQLSALCPDVVIIAAYGQLFPVDALRIPRLGFLNFHPSLLPKYRGVSPIPAVILAGEERTGVTIIKMDEGIDTGPILAQSTVQVLPDDTTDSLSQRLGLLGARLLLETLPRWIRGEIVPEPQEHSQASYIKPIRKEEGLIDWTRPASEIARRVRAFNPWPSAFTFWNGAQLKVLRAEAADAKSSMEVGRVVQIGKEIAVTTSSGVLILREVQLAGKRAMKIEEFVRGQRKFVSAIVQ